MLDHSIGQSLSVANNCQPSPAIGTTVDLESATRWNTVALELHMQIAE